MGRVVELPVLITIAREIYCRARNRRARQHSSVECLNSLAQAAHELVDHLAFARILERGNRRFESAFCFYTLEPTGHLRSEQRP